MFSLLSFAAGLLLCACERDGASDASRTGADNDAREVLSAVDRRIREAYTSAPRAALQLAWRAYHVADSLQLPRQRTGFERTLSIIYRDIDAPDSARLLCLRAMEAGYALEDRSAIAEAHILRAILHYENLQHDSALVEYDRAMAWIDESSDSLLLAKVHANRGNVYSGRGDYSRAIDDYLRAATLFETMGMAEVQATIYDNIAGEYSVLGQQDQAIRFYLLSVEHDLVAGKLLPLATHYANLGVAYKEKGEYDSARTSYLRSLHIAERFDLGAQRAQNYYNLGNLALREGELPHAESMFRESMRLSREFGLAYGIIINQMGLAKLRLEEGRLAAAQSIFDAVLPDLKRRGLRREELEVHRGLSAVAEAQNNPSLALRHLQQAHALQDSLFSRKTHAQMQETQLRYNADRQEAENARLRDDLEYHELTIERQRITVFAISVVVLLALAMLFLQYRSRKRRLAAHHMLEEQKRVIEEKSDKLAESNAIKELLLDIITHDLSNPAGTIRNSAALLREDGPDNELLDIVYRSSGRLIDIIENARTLSQATVFETIPREQLPLRDLVDTAREEFEGELADAGIDLDVQVDPGMTVHANPVIVEVIKNYISNAIKHATGGQRIVIDAAHRDGATEIRVSDFGDSIPEEDRVIIFKRSVQRTHAARRGHGLGLAIAERIARAHGGAVWSEANTPKGNTFVLRLPSKP
ncbi:MAG: tetratricopeptide repeat protein [Bacteroidota bacterium]|nr:tetratricopeptide repeat protein [Bacteroidota bacterium]